MLPMVHSNLHSTRCEDFQKMLGLIYIAYHTTGTISYPNKQKRPLGAERLCSPGGVGLRAKMEADEDVGSVDASPSSGSVGVASTTMLKMWQKRALGRLRVKGSATTRSDRSDTLEEPAKVMVHGGVRFPGSRRRPAKWARPSVDCDMTTIMQLLTRTWGLQPPASLISVELGSRLRLRAH